MTVSHRTGLSRRSFLSAAGALGAATLAAPSILRAQGSTIRVGVPTILSGRVAILGETASIGAKMAVDAVNAAGGIDGRMIELVIRDTKGKPDEAARITRELISTDGCQIILDAEASGGAFAVHEVVRDTGTYCVHSISETSSLTADPANAAHWIFRSGRQGIHDAIAGGLYASELAKGGVRRWATCSPDYAYGRDTTAEFMEFLTIFAPDVKLVGETWPKSFQPDYTENITNLLNLAPEALYTCLWGGDLVAFFDQASLYGLFDQFQTVAVNMGDAPVLEATFPTARRTRTGTKPSANPASCRPTGAGRPIPAPASSSRPSGRPAAALTATSWRRQPGAAPSTARSA
jgi:branched-chain amino acid transport system substrate-binding protein